jgi:phosphatidylinositol phosphate synthase
MTSENQAHLPIFRTSRDSNRTSVQFHYHGAMPSIPILRISADLLLRLGFSPNAVTVMGAIGVVVGAVGFGARGHLIAATLIIAVSVAVDAVDGTMARRSNRTSAFGAFLDSFLDRAADGAIFCSLAYLMFTENRPESAVLALLGLVGSYLVSYARARAEAIGLSGEVGLGQRFTRLIITGCGTFLEGLNVPYALVLALFALVVLSFVTAAQRVMFVFRQASENVNSTGDIA